MKHSYNTKLLVCFSLFLFSFIRVPSVKAELSSSSTCEQIVINLFQPVIQEKVNEYYGEELSSQVILYNYEMHILEMKSEMYQLPTITVKFTPMIGAHNPVADYAIKFSVDDRGNIEVLHFKELKVYSETISRFGLTLPNN